MDSFKKGRDRQDLTAPNSYLIIGYTKETLLGGSQWQGKRLWAHVKTLEALIIFNDFFWSTMTGQMLEYFHRNGANSTFESAQDSIGKAPEQPDLLGLVWARVWARWPPYVLSNLNCSMSLWILISNVFNDQAKCQFGIPLQAEKRS